MHQSWMFLIQAKYMFSYCLGTKVMLPSSTALMAGSARGLVLTYHWLVRYGSMGTPPLSPYGCIMTWSSIFSRRPSFLNSSTTRSRAL